MTWQEGSNLTEIEAARQLFIQDMKILEGIAPESGAYSNEVRFTHIFTVLRLSSFFEKTIVGGSVGFEI